MRFKELVYLLLLVFISIFALAVFFMEKDFNNKTELILQNKLSKLETHYKIFINNLKVLSDNIYDDTMNIKEVKSIISLANRTKDEKLLNGLREKLKRTLDKKYSQIRPKGVLQYHFIFPDNRVFLRMHKPSRYGDNLSGIRQDFEYVNRNKTIVRGFSHGRTAHGFRNAYPLINDEGEHIGAMEVSFSSESLHKHLIELSGIHSHFLIDKDVFEFKAWERDDMVLKYHVSAENENLMFHLTKEQPGDKSLLGNYKRSKNEKELIAQELKKGKKFVFYTYNKENTIAVSFYPIHQNVTKKVVAWIASYENTPAIKRAIVEKRVTLGVVFLILVFIFYFIYKNLSQQILIKQSKEELEKSSKEKDTLLSLFDNGDSVLFKWKNDENMSIDYVSRSVKNLLGYDEKEILKQEFGFLSIVHEEDRQRAFNEIKKASFSKSRFFAHEPYRIKTKDNSEKWVLNYTSVLRDRGDNIKYYLGYLVDITDQKNKERLLYEQSKLASMGEMIGNIAHQWRQPLNVITSAVTSMEYQWDFKTLDDKSFEKLTGSITDNALYLSQTIDDFRNFIKGEREAKQFNLSDNIESFLHLIDSSKRNNYIDMVMDIDEDIELMGYPNELKQCFINIFNNSKDEFLKLGKGKRLFFINAKKEDAGIVVTIKDNAGGIPEDIIDKVFEPYFTTKHQSQGTGLGLHMTYNLIEKGMNGNITAKNSSYLYEGVSYKGVEFKIVLPLNGD